MSGRPSWAITERSAYSPSEWMMLSRWTTTSIFEAGMSNSHRASTTSRPLFIRVAESMVILSPIFQFGCLRACSTVTSRSCSLVRFQSGPPEAVRMSRRMSSTRCPSMDWKSALCSLSTGKIRMPRLRASSCMRRPALLFELVHVAVGREADRLELLGEFADDVQGVGADGAGGTQDDDPLHALFLRKVASRGGNSRIPVS